MAGRQGPLPGAPGIPYGAAPGALRGAGQPAPPAGLAVRALGEADLAAAAAVSATAPDAWSEEALRAGLRSQQAGGAARLFAALRTGRGILPGPIAAAPGLPGLDGAAAGRAGPHALGDSQKGPFAGLVGLAAFQLAAGEASLDTLAVFPAARRQGVGGALLRAALGSLRAEGAEACFLEVRCSNMPAIALYKGLGFTEAGRRPGFYRAPAEDALVMRCPLDSF